MAANNLSFTIANLSRLALGGTAAGTTDMPSICAGVNDILDQYAATAAASADHYAGLKRLFTTFLVAGKRAKNNMFPVAGANAQTATLQLGTRSIPVESGSLNPNITPGAVTFTRLCAAMQLWALTEWPADEERVFPAMASIYTIAANTAGQMLTDLEFLRHFMIPGAHYMFDKATPTAPRNAYVLLACTIMDAKTVNDARKARGLPQITEFSAALMNEIAGLTTGSRMAVAGYGGAEAQTIMASNEFLTFVENLAPWILMLKFSPKIINVRNAARDLAARLA